MSEGDTADDGEAQTESDETEEIEAFESDLTGDGPAEESAEKESADAEPVSEWPPGFKLVCSCDGHGSGLIRGPNDGARARVDLKSHEEQGHDAELERVPVEPRTRGRHVWDEVTE